MTEVSVLTQDGVKSLQDRDLGKSVDVNKLTCSVPKTFPNLSLFLSFMPLVALVVLNENTLLLLRMVRRSQSGLTPSVLTLRRMYRCDSASANLSSVSGLYLMRMGHHYSVFIQEACQFEILAYVFK